MVRVLAENPSVQWFSPYGKCRCGARAAGELFGQRNESFGPHCKKCADRRIKAAKQIRNAEDASALDPFEYCPICGHKAPCRGHRP